MEPDEIEQLLVRTARLTEENHRMLRKMQKAEKARMFMRVVQWVVVIGSFVVLYYLIQPYMAEVKALLESSQSLFNQGGTANDSSLRLLEEYLNSYEAIDVESSTVPESTGSEDVLENVE